VADGAIDWSKAVPVTDPAPKQEAIDWANAKPVPPGSTADALDEKGGLPFTDRVHLASADSYEEKDAYLKSVYGPKNVSFVHEPGGAQHLTVKVGDKWVLAEGGGMLENLGADVVANLPSLGGMAVGAAEGAPLGPLGMIVGAAIGGMAGKTVQKGVQAATAPATARPMTKNYAESIVGAGAGGAAGELGGRAVGGVISKAARGGLPEWLTGTTPEIKEQFRRTKAMGGRPPIQSVAPDMRKLSRMEIMAGKISGEPTKRNAANRAMLEKQTKQIMTNGGVPHTSVDAAYDDLKNGHFAISGENVGEQISKRVQAHQEMLEKRVESAVTTAKAETEKQLKTLDELATKYETGTLGVDVAQGFAAAKQNFSATMGRVYKQVDRLFGGKPIIETDGIRGTARMLLKRSKGVQPTPGAGQVAKVGAPAAEGAADINANPNAEADDIALLKELGIELPENGDGKLTFEQAQRMRSVLREKASSTDPIKTLQKGEISVLAEAVDRAIQAAGAKPEAASAVKLLNAADAAYSEGRAKFADAQLKSFLNAFKKTRTVPDPAQVADLLIQTGKTERALEFKKTLGPEIWSKVESQDMTNMLSRSRNNLTGEIDPSKLASIVAGRRGLVSAIHGDVTEKKMLNFAKNLAATQGKLPAEALEPGQFKALMMQYEDAARDLDEFVKNDPVAALADKKLPPNEVYARVTKPENGDLLKRVMPMLGPKEKAALQETALRQALSESVYTFNNETEISGVLEKYLGKYTREQQDMLFPNGMGDAIRKLGKDMEFVFPVVKDPAMAGMTAGAIQQRFFLRRWWAQGMASAGQWLISHPGFQTYLIGERVPGKLAKGAQTASMQLARFFANEAMSEDTDRPADAQAQ
jgi:hypothetical protein